MTIIYRANAEALANGWDWDTILANNAIETVEEFETYDEAVKAYEQGGYDTDLYGVF